MGSPIEPAATTFAARVRDVAKLLDPSVSSASFAGADDGAYHDACHLARQRVLAAPRRLLQAVEGRPRSARWRDLLRLAGLTTIWSSCDRRNVGAAKRRQSSRRARAVVTGNIGCQTQIASHLRGPDMTCRDATMELLARGLAS